MVSNVTKKSEKIKNLEHQLKRALADYSNLQKRIEADKEQIIQFSKFIILSKFLDVLDNFERLEKEIDIEKKDLKQGLNLTITEFKKVFKEEGVEEIETVGDFNPSIHEAVDVVKGELDNKIVEVVQKGYCIEGKVIRPAKVKVSKRV